MSHLARAAVTAATAVNASSLADVCTVSNVQAALPANGTLLGIDLIPSAITASAVYNASTSMGGMGSSGGVTYSYCNVTITYTHTGKNDEVVVKYAFPQPSDFKKRFYVAGGGKFLRLCSNAQKGRTNYVQVASPSPAPRLEVSSTALLVLLLPLATMPSTTVTTRLFLQATDPSTGMQHTCSPTRLSVR